MVKKQRRCKRLSVTRNVSLVAPCLSPLAELLPEMQDHNDLDLLPLARTDNLPRNNEGCVGRKPMTINHFPNHIQGTKNVANANT